MIPIVAVLIRNKQGKFLFGFRSSNRETFPNTWCPITGKLEDETPLEGALREIKEELGEITVKLIKTGEPFHHITSQGEFWTYVFLFDYLSGKITPNEEHSEIRWMTKEEYLQKEYIPGSEKDFEVLGL